MATPPDLPALAAEHEPKVAAAFIESVQTVVMTVPIGKLIDEITEGLVEAALETIDIQPDDFALLDRAITDAYGAGGDAGAKSIPVKRASGGGVSRIGFDARNLRAEAWIRERSSTLIREITEDQRTLIRQVLTRGMVEGNNPRTTALDLVGRLNKVTGRREGGIIGLTSKQERIISNMIAELNSNDPTIMANAFTRKLRDRRFDKSIKAAIDNKRPIPKDTIDKMAAAYRARWLKYRADTIARTEVMRALGQGQAEAFQQAIDKGAVDVNTIYRTWHTAGDERVRSTHRLIPGMNRGGRAWGIPFQTPTGPSMRAPHDRDIQCRCYERIRIDFLADLD